MKHITNQYRFALDENSKLIDAESLNEDSRNDHFCLGCNGVVRPIIGKVRKKHFRHKVKILCNNETYLHHAAKWIIYSQYRNQLNAKKPYIIEYEQSMKCKLCSEGVCDVEPMFQDFDLTKKFDKILIEQRVDSFRPDLTLLSSTDNEKVFIEIVVNHYSEEKKIESKIRIVEIIIETEEDLDRINIPIIHKNDNIRTYNFQVKPAFVKSTNHCNKLKNCFILYESGKSIVKEIRAYQIPNLDKQGYRFFEIGNNDKSKCYFEGLQSVLEMDIEITNCFFCRYSARNRSRFIDDQPIFCKYLKIVCQSNKAYECKYYKRDNDVAYKNINADG